jgi:aminoglycoside 3-N-acetyltransferase I
VDYRIRSLGPADVAVLHDLLRVFAEAFNDRDAYQGAIPDDAYLRDLLATPHFIVLVAMNGDAVVGGLAAYELRKFERDRREIYIYDLAILEAHRRRGLARALILELKRVAKARGAYVIYVQADRIDAPAIALYESLGTREDVHHFDIAVD